MIELEMLKKQLNQLSHLYEVLDVKVGDLRRDVTLLAKLLEKLEAQVNEREPLVEVEKEQ